MVRLNAVTKRYGGRAVVLDMSLEVARGQYVALVGPSSCGKATLLRLIAGLEQPDAGEIWLDGRLASSPTQLVAPHRRGIGLVFQSLALWPHLTVEEHVAFVLRPAFRRQDLPATIDRLLDSVKLSGKRGSYPGQMSGGEQQRLALARAIATSPALLLLDEPMSSLDRQARGELSLEIRALREAARFTVLHVTHDWRDVRGLADRVIELEQGSFLRECPAAEYFREKSGEELPL
jgi:ABC-type Fe3+/spermidine/putrescine transport system ATPase subunit